MKILVAPGMLGAVLLLLSVAGCGDAPPASSSPTAPSSPTTATAPPAPVFPAASIAGDWTGVIPPFHSDYLVLRFTEQNGAIQGVACWVYLNATPPVIQFRDVPVRMDPSNSAFAVLFSSQRQWSGTVKFDGTLEVVQSDYPVPIVLRAAADVYGTYCRR